MKLFLFTTDVSMALQAQESSIDSIIVDWEKSGKQERQDGYSTEINSDTPEDVAALAKQLTIPITVRINQLGKYTDWEVELALERGARIIMLPMAENPSEVEKFLHIIGGRAETLIQIETQKLVEQCAALRDIGWDYAYIGLNDLMISRKGRWLWEPVLDGTVERVFEILEGRNIGFGGVTVIDGGKPLPFIELLHEMARLGCGLSFLRRTFKREIVGRNLDVEIQAVRSAWEAARRRNPEAVLRDRAAFSNRLLALRNQVMSGSVSFP